MAGFECDVNECSYADLDTVLDTSGSADGRQRSYPDVMQSFCAAAKEAVHTEIGQEVPCGLVASLLINEWADRGSETAINLFEIIAHKSGLDVWEEQDA